MHICSSLSDAKSLNLVNLPELFATARLRLSSSTYIYPGLSLVLPSFYSFSLNTSVLLVETDSIPLSLSVIADLDSPGGLELIKEALASLDTRACYFMISDPY